MKLESLASRAFSSISGISNSHYASTQRLSGPSARISFSESNQPFSRYLSVFGRSMSAPSLGRSSLLDYFLQSKHAPEFPKVSTRLSGCY